MSDYSYEAEIDGVKHTILVKRPNLQQQKEAQKIYNRAFREAVMSGAILREKLEDFMKEQQVWDDEKTKELLRISSEIQTREKRLEAGGIKLSEAKRIALELRRLRDEFTSLLAPKYELDSITAQGQAEQQRFNYLCSVCLVYKDTNRPVFNNVDDYLEKSNEPWAIEGASKLITILSGLDGDYKKNLPENKFLLEFGFMDNDMRLIDEEGRIVDEFGRPLEKFEELKKVEFQPFLDEEGNPVLPKSIQINAGSE